MSLLVKKLRVYAELHQLITLELLDAKIIEGHISEMDEEHVCMAQNDSSEQIFLLAQIRSVEVKESVNNLLLITLQSSQARKLPISITLVDQTSHSGIVDEFDSTMVSLTGKTGERLLAIKEITNAKLLESDLPTQVIIPTSQPSNRKDMESFATSLPTVAVNFQPQDLYPRITQLVDSTRHQLANLNWPKKEMLDLDRESPINLRSDVKGNQIWGRALNYCHDRTWLKAAEEFKLFAASYPEYSTGYFNAGVCFGYTGDIAQAISYYELALQKAVTRNCYLNGIACCVRMGFWRMSIDWIKGYLSLSGGVDADALRAIDFQLRFGLFRDAAATLSDCCQLLYPISLQSGLGYLVYLLQTIPSPADSILAQVDGLIHSKTSTLQDIQQLLAGLEHNLSNTPTIDYRTSIEMEDAWRSSQTNIRDQERVQLLHQKLAGCVQRGDKNEADRLCKQILEIEPQNMIALDYLRKARFTPPSPIYKAPIATSRATSTYQRANQFMTAGNLKEAEALFLSCIKLGDNVENTVKNLAMIYTRQGELQKGINILKEYVPKAREQVPYHNQLGNLYFKAAEYENAVGAYQAVASLTTRQEERIAPMMSIAAVYVRMGRLDSAEAVISKVLKIRSNHPQAKSFLERLKSQTLPIADEGSHQDDIGELLNLLSRPVGTATIGISMFMRLEVDECNITGLDRFRIEKKQFSLKDVEFLIQRGIDVRTSRPEQRFPFFISAARVLSELGDEFNDKFIDSLRSFCAAIGDYYVILNRDVARTYYMEAFKLEPRVTNQLQVKFAQLMMTFLYSDNDVFLTSKLPANVSRLLHNALSKERPPQRITDTIRCVIALCRVNQDLLPVLINYMDNEPGLLNAFAHALSLALDERLVSTVNRELIIGQISRIQDYIGRTQTKIETDLRRFIENSNNYQRLFDMHREFLEFIPEFRLIGVDFNDTDKNRLEDMKKIMRFYVDFYGEQVFETKELNYSYLLGQINTIENDIKDFPTFYGRCYLQPMIRQWRSTITNHYEEVARVSQPNLNITEVVRSSLSYETLDAHLQVSNRQGKSAASGIKIWILPSNSGEYQSSPEPFDVGRTIRAGEDTTVQVTLKPVVSSPSITLNCRLTYTNRDGKEVPTEDIAIPLRMEEEPFQPIDPNPYSVWASADAVTDQKMFKGREELVNDILQILQNEQQRKMIVIYGQKRAGKSSILYHVAKRMTFPAVPIFFSLGEIALDLRIENFFYTIARELYRGLYGVDSELKGLEPTRDQFVMDAFGNFVEYVETLLNAMKQKSQFQDILPVLILDEFTYIYSEIQKGTIHRNFMKAWKALVEKRFFSFLLSGIDEMPDFINAFSNEFGMAELRRVSYLDENGAKDLIEKPIWNQQKDISRFQASAVQSIQQLTANSAYYIQIFQNQLVRYMNDERTGYITEADIRALTERLIEPSKGLLNLGSNFDNLTRYKIGMPQSDDIHIEGLLLRVIAFITRNQDFARDQVIYAKFPIEQREQVEGLIHRLVAREVLVSPSGQPQFALRVELFKHWLNANIPFKEIEQ